jgi:hypothetical protein
MKQFTGAICVVASLVGISALSRSADQPLEIVIEEHGYLLGSKHVDTLSELSSELHRIKPEEVRVLPNEHATSEHVKEVLKVVQEIQASSGASLADRCAARGGIVKRVCITQSEFCVVPFKDAGKPCEDSSQCSGRCEVAPEFWNRSLKVGNAVKGVCQTNNDPCGCQSRVTQGKVEEIRCVD